MVWVYSFPTWIAALIILSVMSAISGTGLWLFTRRFNTGDVATSHNDVAGPIISTAGTVLAVMLSLMVVGVWEEYDASAGVVASEASALADMARFAKALPPEASRELRGSIDRYVRSVVDVEWPLMRGGGESDEARKQCQQLLVDAANLHADTGRQQQIVGMELQLAREAVDARRARIRGNQQTIPAILWAVLIITGFLTIFLTYFFRVRVFGMHLAMTLVLTAVIAFVFLLIAELDLPFRGDSQISPAPYSAAVTALKY